MSEITMSFNEVDFTDIINIKKVTRTIGNNRSADLVNLGKVGGIVKGVSTDSKKITVEFSLSSFAIKDLEFVDTVETGNGERGNINKLREVIAGLFNVGQEGAKLIFSDEPDRYYQAIPIDTVSLEGLHTWYDEAKVTFLVPDGTAHSITYKRIEDYTEYVDKLVFDITNDGTADAYPIVTIENEDENGWIGLVNEHGVFESGQKTEADMAKYKRSERLLDFYGKKGESVAKAVETGIKNDPILNIDNSPMIMNLHINKAWGTSHIAL